MLECLHRYFTLHGGHKSNKCDRYDDTIVFLLHQLHCRSCNAPYQEFPPVGQLAGVAAAQDKTGSSNERQDQRANQQPHCDILCLGDQLTEGLRSI